MYSFNELQGIFEQELRSMKWPREPRLLYEPIAYSLEEGGKRIRPVALLMACSAFRRDRRCEAGRDGHRGFP